MTDRSTTPRIAALLARDEWEFPPWPEVTRGPRLLEMVDHDMGDRWRLDAALEGAAPYFPDDQRREALEAIRAALDFYAAEEAQDSAWRGGKRRLPRRPVQRLEQAVTELVDAYRALPEEARRLLNRRDWAGTVVWLEDAQAQVPSLLDDLKTREVATRRLVYRLDLVWRTFGGRAIATLPGERRLPRHRYVKAVLGPATGYQGERYVTALDNFRRSQGQTEENMSSQ
jgi:hypothetical protein